MKTKYIVRHYYNTYSPMRSSFTGYVVDTIPMVKNLLFHHLEDVDNYIRLHVTARNLIKLEIEYLTVE